ncbi:MULTISPECIES: NAD(P)/FAD-dependent oxidoreductase [Nocardiaceae]|uniref:Cation diffusion facilitator CzcD-associated flavoprotein CzcO n=1 Tax=Rhodococcoides corynebacterioides TaxID=53972 RepID=A0ABS2KZI7_9NOCA|nr:MULTISPECIES: NAD(P)/FAD-dependent oxidoreductase [Rhodococcus]MBM7417360.1 cation diffusion facilitator CzcD-associated flavoprotein CzcO [Rhodococcus corynebacterioides]MBP1115613.1 cation diffusion facilitator CzcD-associated flavoprotein CzcO [Rhodococcus sp. PvP016]
MDSTSPEQVAQDGATTVDAVVIGAGIGGLYAVRRLAADGLSVLGFDSASDVGGVWRHNGYPGARVDIEAYYYSFFDPEIYPEWKWSMRYPPQGELLAYLQHYADHYGLRQFFRFSTRVQEMQWQAENNRWQVRTDTGDTVFARHVVMATGQLSKSRQLPFAGVEDFQGQWLETSHWPDEPVDLTGKRVAVIGTGSSGAQVIAAIAGQVESLHVFQRTPNYVVPSQNSPMDQDRYRQLGENLGELWEQVMGTGVAYLAPTTDTPASAMTPEQQQQRLEDQWAFGGLSMTFAFPDQKTDWKTNDLVSNFVRSKIRSAVSDPALADKLEPRDYPIGTRRLVVCNGYYEAFNQDNVHLVDLRTDSIRRVTATGIETSEGFHEVDVIISALGFDAFTGALDAIDIRNAEGKKPTDGWERGPHAYLGLMVHGFPNLYVLTGPGSPSVLVNFNVHNVYHVDYVANLIAYMDRHGHASVDATLDAQDEWHVRTQEAADGLLRKQVKNYMVHVNDDGSRVFIPYSGGWSTYVGIADKIAEEGYTGFTFAGRDGVESDSDHRTSDALSMQ